MQKIAAVDGWKDIGSALAVGLDNETAFDSGSSLIAVAMQVQNWTGNQ
jgi:hypothetical protein